MSFLTLREVPVWDTGLVLVLVSDGRIIIERGFNFVPLYELGVFEAIFNSDGFTIKDLNGEPQNYDYGVAYPYKEMPLLKQWLIQQKLEMN